MNGFQYLRKTFIIPVVTGQINFTLLCFNNFDFLPHAPCSCSVVDWLIKVPFRACLKTPSKAHGVKKCLKILTYDIFQTDAYLLRDAPHRSDDGAFPAPGLRWENGAPLQPPGPGMIVPFQEQATYLSASSVADPYQVLLFFCQNLVDTRIA